MNQKGLKKYFIVLIALAMAAAGYFIFIKNKVSVQAPPATIQYFVNSNGKYSFEFPNVWKATINQYNNSDSLFGSNANSASGLGGVEVFQNEKSIEDFQGGISAQYSGKMGIVIDGVTGIRAHYDAYPQSGEQAVLLKNGIIYNIYINSTKSEDLKYFDQIVSSFKFIR